MCSGRAPISQVGLKAKVFFSVLRTVCFYLGLYFSPFHLPADSEDSVFMLTLRVKIFICSLLFFPDDFN